MQDIRIGRWAHTLVHYCLSVEAGETVAIRATPLAAPLVEAVYRELLQVGAYPLPLSNWRALKRFWCVRGTMASLLCLILCYMRWRNVLMRNSRLGRRAIRSLWAGLSQDVSPGEGRRRRILRGCCAGASRRGRIAGPRRFIQQQPMPRMLRCRCTTLRNLCLMCVS